MPTPFPHTDLVSLASWSGEDIRTIFAVAAELKADRKREEGRWTRFLPGKRLAMIFEKESLRTRFTFDIGIQDLGGSAVFLDHSYARLGARESVPDMAKNLERWTDGIVARTYRQRSVVDLAQHACVPVINGLSDLLHPCQALTDTFTLTEKFGDVRGRTLCFIGDGNNTCHSLLHAGAKLGMNVTVCTPEGYEPNLKVMNQAISDAEESGAKISLVGDPLRAVKGVDAIYTDVWASMGQEDETEERSAIFADYQVNDDIMDAAGDALFMHCLPAHRGHEVTASVLDGPSSIVFDIAENRLHVQKAVMALLMGGDDAVAALIAESSAQSAA